MRLFIILMAIGLGGALGAVIRHLAAAFFHDLLDWPVFVAIMIVNISGAYVIGLVFILLESQLNRDVPSRLRNLDLAAPLINRGWWPEPDPTQIIERDFESNLRAELTAAFFITGVLGGMTTFSLFSLLSLELAQGGHWGYMAINIVGSIVLGFIATYLGLLSGVQLIIKHAQRGGDAAS